MSVVIGIDSTNCDCFGMSNGGMAVFLSTIILSGSRIAVSEKEQELIQWFAQHDDTVRGRGLNGFDIREIPCSVESFDAEMLFMINVANAAKTKSGWETLHYEPKEEYIFSFLDSFLRLLSQFKQDQVDPDGYSKWKSRQDDPPIHIIDGQLKCEKHQALLYWGGCLICNDE